MLEWLYQRWDRQKYSRKVAEQAVTEMEKLQHGLTDLVTLMRSHHERRQEEMPPPNGIERRRQVHK